MQLTGRRMTRAGLVMAVLAAGAAAALAGEVTLQLKDGGFTVTGELIGNDGTNYVIQSKVMGTMTLDASKFDCIGEACSNVVTGAAPAPAEATAAVPPAPTPAIDPAKGFAIYGSSTIGTKLMPALIKAYAASIGASITTLAGSDPQAVTYKLTDSAGNEIVQIPLKRQGSASAFESLASGEADLGMSDRPITDAEVAALTAAGFPNMRLAEHEHVIALDGIVVAVAPQNATFALSSDEVARIFSGEITDWGQLGLPKGQINVYAPDDNQGTFATFNSLILKPRNLTILPGAQRFTSNADISDKVAEDPNGIALTSFAFRRGAKPINIATPCGIITKPSEFTVKAEEYPLSRRLYVYTAREPANPHAKALLDFIKSQAAQQVVLENDFVDQGVEMLGFEAHGGRIAHALNAFPDDFSMPLMRELISDITAAKRLSITIHFLPGSFDLDSRGTQDVARLVSMLQSQDLNGKEVLLLGFADTTGDFKANRVLAVRRAISTLDAVTKASGGTINATVIISKSYSELAPVACNESPEGRDMNRRVEVWVRDRFSGRVIAGVVTTDPDAAVKTVKKKKKKVEGATADASGGAATTSP